MTTRAPAGWYRSRKIRWSAVIVLVATVMVGCTGDGAPAGSAGPSLSPMPSPTATPLVMADADVAAQLCENVGDLEFSTARLRAVELKLVNRVALTIELNDVMDTFDELQRTDLGRLDEQLDTPLTRLGYRLGELELAVEDFRTNSRIRRAIPHVRDDAETFANEVSAFKLLARC